MCSAMNPNSLHCSNKQGNVTDADVLAARGLVEKSIERNSNIYVQPHQGFNSDIAAQTKAVEAIEHVAAWFRNRGQML